MKHGFGALLSTALEWSAASSSSHPLLPWAAAYRVLRAGRGWAQPCQGLGTCQSPVLWLGYGLFFTPSGCLAWGLKLDLWAQTRLGFVACPPRSLGSASHIPSLIPRGPPLSQHPTFLEIREVLGGSGLNPAQVMIWGRSHSSGMWQPPRGEEKRKRWEEGQGLV